MPTRPFRAPEAPHLTPRFTLRTPDGVEEVLQPAAGGGKGFNAPLTFHLPRLTEPGIAEIRSGGAQTLTRLAVNPDALESDTRRIPADDLKRFWESCGFPAGNVAEIAPGGELQTAVLQSRFGVELWKYCIGLALLAALAEMLIARDSRAQSGAPQ